MGDGEMGRWGGGEMGIGDRGWGDGEMGRWGDGEKKSCLLLPAIAIKEKQAHFSTPVRNYFPNFLSRS
jgi:hypothetical protein